MDIPADYILVRDEAGDLKYYKGGQFYDLAAVEKKVAAEQQPTFKVPATAVFELKAVDTYEEHKASKRADSLGDALSQRRSENQQAVQKKVQAVIDKLKIQFSDEDIRRRFNNVLTTYFRGLRGEKEVGYMLTLPKISGGLELAADKVKIILTVLKQFDGESLSPRPVTASPLTDARKKVLATLAPAPPLPSRAEPLTAPRKVFPTIQAVKIVSPTKPLEAARPPMVDIQRERTALTGPVEELAQMDVRNLRQLGKNVPEILEELKERIQLLAEQSLAKKLQGIQAWQSAPVFLLYLDMNLQGVAAGQTMAQVIEARQIKNEPSLTLSELEMISAFNQSLTE